MGVQILNKDVSVVSSILSKPKATISSVNGIGGWTGGGVDVTPNPTPDWGGYYETASPVYSSTQQVTGINTVIKLGINILTNDGGILNVGINNSNSYGGTIIDISNGITTFPVNNNEYVTFKWEGSSPGYLISFDVINQSDGNVTLGTNITLVRA